VSRGTLGGRLFASLAAGIAVLLLGAALWGESRIRAFHREEVTRRLATATHLLEDLARDGFSGRIPPAELRARIDALRLGGPIRVTLIADDGEVLADTAARLPLRNHAERPEVLAARSSGTGSDARTSESTGVGTLYLARRLDGPSGVAGFLRLAEPLERAEAEVAGLRNTLLVGLGVYLLLVSAFVARGVARPLEAMEAAAADLAAGAADVRVEPEGPPEVQRLAVSLRRMADRIRERMDAERRARTELEAVLAGIGEGVVAVDGRERILFMNDAGARILGLPSPLPAGGALWETLRFPELEVPVREALRGGRPGPRDAASPARDGRVLEVLAGPLAGGNGAVAVLRDVTEVRRLERIRMDFVANVSHELRTPLAGVSGALETLEDAGLDGGERARFLAIARRNAERMRALVKDLLDLSVIEAEEAAPARDRFPLDRPVRAAAAALADMADRCRVALVVEPGAASPEVEGSERRMEQAVGNLVENALKYTPAGGRVLLRVRESGAEAAVEVADTGMGMPAAALPRIFERFYRVDPSRSREMGGTGLGLAIVKHVVRAHRGRVEVASTEGAGTTFTITLPRAPSGG
jgi:two-component system phosphate regulon sensor histidine kinase PhoR